MSDTTYDRRAFMAYFSSIGLTSTLLPGVLWGQVAGQQQPNDITKEMVADAEKIAGLSFTEEERASIANGLRGARANAQQVRALALPNATPPAFVFDPIPPGESMPAIKKVAVVRAPIAVMARPGSLDELAYAGVAKLSAMVHARKVKPSELTEMYLSRLKRYDPQLHCVITLTEERARQQAKDLDREAALGKFRGPLHGIPWGAKDLFSVKGYPTTWGAGLYKDQSFDVDSTVVTRLDKAGAILVAKLTLGALAQGDIWYGERTRNPWNPAQGSSGSSAGPASATAAGCVAFGIGTETNGSITSPSSRCGLSGLRPTFGRVPRTGGMALSWTMDKTGPMCRSAEDCAFVFDAIHGPDGLDRAVMREVPFNWNPAARLSSIRIGYFVARNQAGEVQPVSERLQNVLKVLETQGAKPTPIETPNPTYAYLASITLNAECGAAFQPDTVNGKIRELDTPRDFLGGTGAYSTWGSTFRNAQFIGASDYINAQRGRTLVMKQWWDLFRNVDVIVTQAENTSVTNITGTPSITIPVGFAPAAQGRGAAGGRGGAGDTASCTPAPPAPDVPFDIRFLGALYRDDLILRVAHGFQEKTDFHHRKPSQFA